MKSPIVESLERVSLALALLITGESATQAGLIVGAFNTARSGDASVSSGNLADELRAALVGEFAGISFVDTDTLTSEFLSGLDVFVTSNAGGTDPFITLSPAEQSALIDFVTGGGAAILVVDPFKFQPGGPTGNDFTMPFGVEMSLGEVLGTDVGEVINPPAHPVTNGPFGLVPQFTTGYPGWFTSVGAATPLATLAGNGQVSLAVLDDGVLAPGSGRVVLASDASAFGDSPLLFSENQSLFLNAFAYVAKIPEPTSIVVVASGVLCSVCACQLRRI
jgi:hypothetical protein